MASRRWRRVDDPWDTLPSPGLLDERASALQVGEHLRRLRFDDDVVISVERARAIAVARGFGEDDQEAVLRHMADRVGEPFKLPRCPYRLPDEFGLREDHCPTPSKVWWVRRSSGVDAIWDAPCNRWRCPACGEANAWTKLAEADFRFRSVDGLWVAHAPTDRETTVRIRQRRQYHRPVRDLSVTRHDGTKWVYASVALGGRQPPERGEWMTVDGALLHLQDVALEPSHAVRRVQSSGGWPPLPAEILGDGDFLYLDEGDDLRAEINDEVLARAVSEFRVDPADEGWRTQTPRGWVATAMSEAVNERR